MGTSEPGGMNTQRWIRLPTRGRCQYTGFSRAFYYDLITRGLIKSANVKKPGKLTGVRLVWLPSVLAFIEEHVVTPGVDPLRRTERP